ncbi:MAG: glycosyltransferase [Actinomycetota bacterium]
MRVLVWHGWLLEGSGSNVYTARVAEVWRRLGHDVALLCQQPGADGFDFVDAYGTVGPDGVSELTGTGSVPGPGRVVLLRPSIGRLLPVFVLDEYEGFEVRRFVDLGDADLEGYLDRNVAALESAVAWHRPDVVVTGHAVPGAAVAKRALAGAPFVAKIHGSDLEYAVREQPRYRTLAAEGLAAARRVVGASRDVLARTVELVPEAAGRTRVVPPGVELERWRPRTRAEALGAAASLLDADPGTARGRPQHLDARVVDLLAARDAEGLGALARTYDQSVPDPGAAARLRSLAVRGDPLVGYLGKLIPEKGVERLLEAVAVAGRDVAALVVGFGLFREWLVAVVATLDRGDPGAAAWLGESSPMHLELAAGEVEAAAGLAARVTFTGRLDHRFAPEAVAAMDVLVVPSTLEEAFGMVVAEGAAAGALPLVARHSALAEVADALEGAAGRPGLFSFEPGPGSTRRLAERLRALLSLPEGERAELQAAVRAHVVAEWTWERTAERLLEAGRS